MSCNRCFHFTYPTLYLIDLINSLYHSQYYNHLPNSSNILHIPQHAGENEKFIFHSEVNMKTFIFHLEVNCPHEIWLPISVWPFSISHPELWNMNCPPGNISPIPLLLFSMSRYLYTMVSFQGIETFI